MACHPAGGCEGLPLQAGGENGGGGDADADGGYGIIAVLTSQASCPVSYVYGGRVMPRTARVGVTQRQGRLVLLSTRPIASLRLCTTFQQCVCSSVSRRQGGSILVLWPCNFVHSLMLSSDSHEASPSCSTTVCSQRLTCSYTWPRQDTNSIRQHYISSCIALEL